MEASYEQQERIERYLTNKMSLEERVAFEHALQVDETLRREVKLYQSIQEALADPARLELRRMLQEITSSTPEPCMSTNKPGRLWLVYALFALALCALIWWYTRPGETQLLLPAQEEPIPDLFQKEAPNSAGEPVVTAPAPDLPPRTGRPQPLAMAESFKPNPSMEALAGSFTRGTGPLLQLISPVPNASIKPDSGGVVHLTWRGEAGAGYTEFKLHVYNNQSPYPLYAETLTVRSGTLAVEHHADLRLPPGLYYYTLEHTDTGDMAFAARFTIPKPSK